MGSFFSSFGPRTVASLTTLPSWTQLGYVVGVTVLTVGGGGLVAYYTDFVHPVHDYNPPWPFPPTKNTNYNKKKLYTNKERCVSLLKPFSAYIFPALLEEILWRGADVVPQSRREYRTLHGCAVGMVARNLSGARSRPSPSGLDVLAPRTDDLSGLSLFTLSDHLFGRGHQFVSSQ